jgi:HK97 family phage prohead protease
MQPDEIRIYGATLELREVEVTGKPYTHLEGRAVPYGTWGELAWFREMHAPDSLKRTTTGNIGKNLPLCLFHDNRTFPIGHAEKWEHPTDGLHGVWKLNTSPEAQRAAGAFAAGDMRGLSIGFAPIRSEWEYVEDWNPDLGPEHKDRVTRIESRLLEVSITPTPVFGDAEVTAVRTAFDVATRSAQMRERNRRAVDAWRTQVDALRSGSSS